MVEAPNSRELKPPDLKPRVADTNQRTSSDMAYSMPNLGVNALQLLSGASPNGLKPSSGLLAMRSAAVAGAGILRKVKL